MIFKLIIAYFGMLRMHAIAPFFHFFPAGYTCIPGPPSTGVYSHAYRATYALSLVITSCFFIQTLKIVDQIHVYTY